MRSREHIPRLEDELARLPFIKGVRLEEPAGSGHLRIVLRTPEGSFRLLADVKRSALSYSLVDRVLSSTSPLDKADTGHILLASYVSPQMGRYLSEHGWNFIDEAGNCRLILDSRYVAIVEGRKPPPRPVSRLGIRAPGYQVIFALLAKPDLLRATVREIADAAGVGKSTAATTLRRLREELTLAPAGRGDRLLQPVELMERWLVAYRDVVRPHLFVGSFQARESDPAELERRIEADLGARGIPWFWGGGAALWRINSEYHGPSTVLHLPEPPLDLPRILRALPARQGPLQVLRVPGPVGEEGLIPQTVHPLLVYTELITEDDPRGREVAEQFRARFLEASP